MRDFESPKNLSLSPHRNPTSQRSVRLIQFHPINFFLSHPSPSPRALTAWVLSVKCVYSRQWQRESPNPRSTEFICALLLCTSQLYASSSSSSSLLSSSLLYGATFTLLTVTDNSLGWTHMTSLTFTFFFSSSLFYLFSVFPLESRAQQHGQEKS